jgi:hypothetical protein
MTWYRIYQGWLAGNASHNVRGIYNKDASSIQKSTLTRITTTKMGGAMTRLGGKEVRAWKLDKHMTVPLNERNGRPIYVRKQEMAVQRLERHCTRNHSEAGSEPGAHRR